MIESAADIFSRPKVFYTVKTWYIEGKTILEVDIPESSVKPHLAPWKNDLWRAYVRENDQNFLADPIMVQVWKNKREQKATLIRYNRIEQVLLEYLKNEPEITLKEFCELSEIKHPIAKRVLINLVTIGVIKINTFENTSTYSLSNEIN